MSAPHPDALRNLEAKLRWFDRHRYCTFPSAFSTRSALTGSSWTRAPVASTRHARQHCRSVHRAPLRVYGTALGRLDPLR